MTLALLTLGVPAPAADAPRRTFAIGETDFVLDGKPILIRCGDNVFDLQATTFWHTQWETGKPKHPHELVIDLGAAVKAAGLRHLPRQDSPNGRIKEYRIYLSGAPYPGL